MRRTPVTSGELSSARTQSAVPPADALSMRNSSCETEIVSRYEARQRFDSASRFQQSMTVEMSGRAGISGLRSGRVEVCGREKVDGRAQSPARGAGDLWSKLTTKEAVSAESGR